MPISIISASTGNGHNAVMNTLAEAFKKEYAVKCYPCFYEDLLPSNRTLSNFYNLLQKASIALCKKYTELAIFEGKETQNRLYGLKAGKPVLLMNSGAQGSFHYLNIIKAIVPKYRLNFQLIVICGKNKGLFRATQLYCHKNGIKNIVVLPYINNMEELLYISDACITKAGANMVYECLLACMPLIIDSTEGLLYQEQGIVQFLKKYSIGYVFEDTEALNNILHALDGDGLTEQLKRNIDAMHLVNGTEKIVNSILNDISVSNTANEVKG